MKKGNEKSETEQANSENGCLRNIDLPRCKDATNRLKKINRLKRLTRMFFLMQRGKLRHGSQVANNKKALNTMESKYRIPRGGDGLPDGSIDLTGSWITTDIEKTKSSSREIPSRAKLSSDGVKVQGKVSSGGYSGIAVDAATQSRAQGPLHVEAEASVGKDGFEARVRSPSGEASALAGAFGAKADLGSADIINKKDHKKVGIHGPGGSVNIGPFGFGLKVGVGAESSRDIKKGVGSKVITPAGSFGAKLRCINEICFIGCIKIKVC